VEEEFDHLPGGLAADGGDILVGEFGA